MRILKVTPLQMHSIVQTHLVCHDKIKALTSRTYIANLDKENVDQHRQSCGYINTKQTNLKLKA